MTNLITSDAAYFEFAVFNFIGMFSTPVQIIISSIMLWKYLGWATLVGLASMILFMPLNGILARIQKKLRIQKQKLSDKRIKALNEVLSGIRVIKFMGWELSFEKLIKKVRENELTNLIKTSLLHAVSGFTW